MIISHRHRFIFVKTHKTAGSSLEVALALECGPDDVVSHMEDNIATGIPRNYGPTSRLGSAYRRSRMLRKLVGRHSPLLGAYYYEHMPAWRIRELVGEDIWRDYFTFCFERNSWDKTVSYYLWKKHGQDRSMPEFADYIERKSHRLPVDSALYCDDGAVIVDRIFEFRELSSALAELRERLGLQLPEPLPREKTGVATQRKPYADYYDEETRQRVAELYQREIELMGYAFSSEAGRST
ncbi:MAG: sulfotransferase family 2 domain-containing protein [Pseudomonadota bacterium]